VTGEAMTKPDTIIIDGHAFRWKRLCDLRREQLEASNWRHGRPLNPGSLRYSNCAMIAAHRPNGQSPGDTRSQPCSLFGTERGNPLGMEPQT
jgi:hypothetical protein